MIGGVRIVRRCALACMLGSTASCGHSFDPQVPLSADSWDAGADPKPPAAAFRGCPVVDEYRATAAERESAFARLTATKWVASNSSLTLGRDGTFAWRAANIDYVTAYSGRYDFALDGPDSGAIFTSTGSMVLFDIGDATLDTSYGQFKPGDPATSTGTVAALTRVEPPAPYRELAGTCWRLANDFGGDDAPDRLSFPSAFRFVVGFHGGSCEQGARISLVNGQENAYAPGGTCSPSSGVSLERPDLAGDLLLTGSGTFRPLADPTDEKAFAFDSWRTSRGKPFREEGAVSGGSVRVTGRYRGDWLQGAATHVSFELENVATVGARLRSFTLVLQRYQLSADPSAGYTALGDPDYHELANFDEEHLDVHGKRRLEVDITPAVAGALVYASFKLGLKLFDGDALDNVGAFWLRIAAGTPVAPTPVPTSPPLTASPPGYSSCGTLDSQIEPTSLAFSPDGALLAIGAYDRVGEAQVWDVAAHALRFRAPPAEGATFTSSTGAAFVGDSLLRSHGSALDRIAVSNGQIGSVLIAGSSDVTDRLGPPAVSPDGRWMAIGHEGALEIWSTETWKPVQGLRGKNAAPLGWGVFSPAGAIAAFGNSSVVSLMDPTTGALSRELVDHTDLPVCAAFGDAGRLLVTGARDNTLVLWNTSDGSVRRRLDAGSFLRDCELAPDGTLVALLDLDLTLFRTDVESKPLVLPGHDKTIVAVSPDGARIAAGALHSVELFCRDSMAP